MHKLHRPARRPHVLVGWRDVVESTTAGIHFSFVWTHFHYESTCRTQRSSLASEPTSVGHSRLNDVQRRVVFTQVVGHVPIGVDRKQIRAAVGDKHINDRYDLGRSVWVAIVYGRENPCEAHLPILLGDKDFHQSGMATGGGGVQRRPQLIVLRVDIGSSAQ